MVGNDVVDLLDSDSDPRALHPRFDGRVFTPAEREAIEASADPSEQRWRLWAAKEAAFKVLVKRQPGHGFAPRCFEVSLALEACGGEAGEHLRAGVVECAGEQISVRVARVDGALHAVATSAGDGAGLCGFRRLPGGEPRDPHAPGRAARALAIEAVAQRLGVSPEKLEIRKRGRVPELWCAGAQLEADLSLSHHGAVVGFATDLGAVKAAVCGSRS